MINSSKRKLALAGWLKENDSSSFYSSLKLQKFLFFYETTEKLQGNESDFNYLKGYKNGPIFSTVYGDFTYREDEFEQMAVAAYEQHKSLINSYASKFASFMVKIHNECELSHLTHEFSIWKSKKQQIESGKQQLDLNEIDFNDCDISLLASLHDAYSEEYLDNVRVLSIHDKNFIINKSDYDRLPDGIDSMLETLSWDNELINPVYVSIDTDGGLLID